MNRNKNLATKQKLNLYVWTPPLCDVHYNECLRMQAPKLCAYDDLPMDRAKKDDMSEIQAARKTRIAVELMDLVLHDGELFSVSNRETSDPRTTYTSIGITIRSDDG